MRKLFFFKSSSHDSSIVPNAKMQEAPVGDRIIRDSLNGGKDNQIREVSVLNQKSHASTHYEDPPMRETTPESELEIKKPDSWYRQPHGSGKVRPKNPPRSYAESCTSSPCSSPMPLRCRSALFAQASSGTLDLYMKEEQDDRDEKHKQEPSSAGEDDILAENRPFRNMGRRPLNQASSGMHSRGNKLCKSQSFRLVRDSDSIFSSRDRLSSPLSDPNLPEKVSERLKNPLPRKCNLKLRQFGSETSTMDDYVEDYLQKHVDLEPCSLVPGHKWQCDGTHIQSTTINGFLGAKQASSVYREQEEEKDERSLKTFYEKDEKLVEECKMAEQRLRCCSNELEVHYQCREWGSDELIHLLHMLSEDKRKLAAEVVEQLQRRIAERSYMKNTIEIEKIEHETFARKTEKEKDEIQSCLERELDRRSNDWSSKHEKFKTEEKRLRERVRDLAEQSVSLQLEIVSLSRKDTENLARLANSELQINELTRKLEEANLKNSSLQKSLSTIEEHYEATKFDRDLMARSYKDKENESKDFQKMVVILQKTCDEQNKTIDGLRLNLTADIEDSFDRTDLIHKLQMEQTRLTGLEQTLRKELNSSRFELETLRKENVSLLNRMQSGGNCGGPAILKLDEELHARMESLQEHGLFLLHQNGMICATLLDKLKLFKNSFTGQGEDVCQLAGYSLIETEMTVQSLKRETERFKMSLQTTCDYLHEKLSLVAHDGCQLPHINGNEPQLLKSSVRGDFEREAEVLLAKVLKESLWSKETELENLQTELASFVRLNDLLKTEMQTTQDSLSCLTHKLKVLELEVVEKNASIDTLDKNLQKCQKELTVLKGMLTQISGERDVMWDQVKEYSEKNMLQNYELDALRKKLEVLDEEILIKEGQITILKDSLNDKPYEMLYSPKSSHDLALSELCQHNDCTESTPPTLGRFRRPFFGIDV